MPAKGRVSIGWQIVFAIISPVNLWAFYRIKRLRLFVLYVMVPSIAISSIVIAGVFYEMGNPEIIEEYPEPSLPSYMTPIEPQVGKFNTGKYMMLNLASSIGLTVLSVYLIVKWSRQWNEQFT